MRAPLAPAPVLQLSKSGYSATVLLVLVVVLPEYTQAEYSATVTWAERHSAAQAGTGRSLSASLAKLDSH
eukprot:950417-Rhodomonas_salina.1